MAFDLDEQEQMENLRAFWERWGKWITAALMIGVIAVLGWKGFGYYQVKQSEKASQTYEAYATALQKKDPGTEATLATLQKDFAKSRYTALATLDAANAAIVDKQWDKAQAALQWLVSNGTLENQAVARLQLADVLAQMAKNDEALKTLETIPTPEFTAAFANKKADVYLLMNDNAKARESVQAAITWLGTQAVKDEQLEKALKEKLEFLPI